ncbi:MAG: methyltransferase [Gammaproteobacteria bacterium]|jgi:hypothetical protein
MLLLYNLFIQLILAPIKFGLRRYHIRQWENRIQLKKHLTTLDTISCPINGFELSRQAREHTNAYEYVYGEINSKSLIALLSLTHPDSSTVFYDLGSGTGKAVLACAMVFDVKKSCGIELFPILDGAAKQQLAQLQCIPEYQENAQKITFVCDNFLTANLADATVIFVAATGLFGDTWEQLNQRLEQLSHNPIIITTTKKLLSPQFKVLHQTRVQMSWGIVNAYIQHSLIDS